MSHLSWVTGLLGPEFPPLRARVLPWPVCRPRLSSPSGSGWPGMGSRISRGRGGA